MASVVLAVGLAALGAYLIWCVWAATRDFKAGRARFYWPWAMYVYRDKTPGLFWTAHTINVLQFVLFMLALAVVAFVKPGGGLRL